MRKRRLPLDSPNWTPLDELHPLVCAQTGDRRFADRDLTDAMATDRVRSMRRRVSPRADEPERELLLPSFWADYQLNSDTGAGDGEQQLLVVERARCPQPPWLREGVPPGLNRTMLGLRGVPLRGYVFYAWKPDCKKFLVWVLRWRTQGSQRTKSSKNQGVPRLFNGKNCARKSCVVVGKRAGLLHRKAIRY